MASPSQSLEIILTRLNLMEVTLLGLVFQKAKYFFKKRPQFFLVVFIEGEFAEPHPLFLICQISQISCGISSCTIAGTLLNSPSAKHLSLIQENAWFMGKGVAEDFPSSKPLSAEEEVEECLEFYWPTTMTRSAARYRRLWNVTALRSLP
jgi:hypothetical protein